MASAVTNLLPKKTYENAVKQHGFGARTQGGPPSQAETSLPDLTPSGRVDFCLSRPQWQVASLRLGLPSSSVAVRVQGGVP